MKYPTLNLAVLAVLLAGCAVDPMKAPRSGAGDLLLGASMQRAIVVQSSLYPYHFVPDSAELNELGVNDLNVLAMHLRDHAGSLLISRGGASKELHEARVRAVLAALEESGVAKTQVAVHDGLPGGDGLPSGKVVDILKKPLILTGAGVSQTGTSATSTTGDGSATDATP
ncbi:MAG TPA: hypothetical protein VFY71_06695 [Planctomycetota bacterium]|nr:hypothetical protein [Planctomycetota bacterium]